MTNYGYTYDYTKTMMMKMKLSDPDRKGGTTVLISIEKALEIIRIIDALTLGAPKIVYLVGWQYCGHDDKYPDFFLANPALKRPEDKTANESVLWLMRQAKAYHTQISFHINFNDAYEDAPSFNEYVDRKALIRKKNGEPHAIECYNGKKCFKVCLKQAWETGLFQRQVDRLLTLFPLEEIGTVHVDNFQCYTNYAPRVSIGEMSEARDKMIAYLREKGIDITSEFTYRESEKMPNKTFLGLPRDHSRTRPIHTLGKIPAVWWLTYMSNKDIVNIPPQLFTGGMTRKPKSDFIYGNMHGEDIFDKLAKGDQNWSAAFLHDYATVQLPYQFLCRYKRLSVSGRSGNYTLHCSEDVRSYQKESKITVDGACVKDGSNVLLPLPHRENAYLAYSKSGDTREWLLPANLTAPFTKYAVTADGMIELGKQTVQNGKITLTIAPRQAILLQPV